MPGKIKKTPYIDRRRRRSEAEKEAHRQEMQRAGGWYMWHKQQREAREQAPNGQSEGR